MDVTAIVAVSLFTIIFAVGVPGNFLVVWVFAKKSRKTTTSLLILSLAIIDLCACLIAPVHLVRALGGVFINAFVCRSSIYGSRAFSFSALYLTSCIALDRYMAVCRPLETRSNPRRVTAVILVSIGLAVSGNFQYALYVILFQIGPVKKCIYRGGPDWLDLSNEIFTSASYLLALIICTCVYVRIYLEIRKHIKVRAGLTGKEVQVPHGTAKPAWNTNQSCLPQQSGPTADCPTNQGKVTTAPAPKLQSRGGSSGIGPGATTNGNPLKNLSEVGTTQVLHIKVPEIVPAIPSAADYSSNPASVGQDQLNVPARKDAGQPFHRNRQKKERVMTRMLLGTNLILILSWLPSFILTNIPDEAVADYRSTASQGGVISFCYHLRTLNHIVSIFVYALLNANFRKDCKAIFARRIHHDEEATQTPNTPTREEMTFDPTSDGGRSPTPTPCASPPAEVDHQQTTRSGRVIKKHEKLTY
ncbi:gastrin/cholecystokinin type B receptor-like [Strongylocentrotus purpuratus]|uniref:G-protein coupled receptors family 1 profile domain-containing protein n=1 Tax=Strongylocentrotus purpuratus TaxID=7668 RepID=A0A7M7P1A2_STRPU|nr:gastrin/cholecystokinin type B receptor-like [Strongylocentrotus purpuratus]